jgi:AcrR family transcriptional regulator
VPTSERILQRALELFAEKGYDGVTVREIVKPLGLTEATLYVHFKSKAALLEAIFERLERNLIAPGFTASQDAFPGPEPFDLTEHLLAGAQRFFSRADRETRLTWRLLMVSQYRFETARRALTDSILDAPVRFFTALLERLKQEERLKNHVDAHALARVVASIFFERSFRANLVAAWEDTPPDVLEGLRAELDLITQAITR